MAIGIRGKLINSVQKLRDRTSLDERAGAFVQNRLKPIGQNFAQAGRNLTTPQTYRSNFNEVGKYFRPKALLGGNQAELGRMAMDQISPDRKFTRNALEFSTRLPGAITKGLSFGTFDPLKNKPAQTWGGSGGDLVGNMAGFARSPITRGITRLTNPYALKLTNKLSPSLAPIAGSLAPKISGAVANVAQGRVFDVAQGQNPLNPASIGLDAVTGLVAGPNQFDEALKPIGKGFGTGRNKHIPWHPQDTSKLDQLTDFVNTNKKIDIETANQLDIEYSRLADGYLPKKTVTDLAQKYSKNPRKYFIELSKELQKSFRRVGEEDTFNLPKLGIVGGSQATGYKNATQFSSMLDQKPRFEIDDSGAKLKWNFSEINKKTIPLTDILDHKELFKQYPNLKNLNVKVDIDPHGSSLQSSKRGTFDGNSITLTGGDSLKDIKSTLLHEIQHAIQEIEGFARGGSPTQMGSSDMMRKYAKDGELPFDLYKRSAGELESRAVQRRMDMPADQRLKVDPYSDEARATTGTTNPNDFITRFDGGTQASIDRTKLTGRQLDTPNAKLGFEAEMDAINAKRPDVKFEPQNKKAKVISQDDANEALTGAVMAENEPKVFRNLIAKYIGKRDVAQTEATRQAIKLKDVPIGKDKFKEFADHIEGVAKSSDPKIVGAEKSFRAEMDKVFKDAQKAGVDMNYQKGYITHFWELPRDEVARQYKVLKQKEFIQNNREVPTYDEGIKMGLKPKYENVALLAQDYVGRVERLKASLELFKDMKAQGLVVPASIGSKTPGFQPITSAGFPRNNSSFNGQTVEGFWYAPDSVVKQLNRVFDESPDIGTIGRVAEAGKTISGKIQDVALSGGLPGTPLNAFTLAQAQKEILAGRVLSPLKAIFRGRTTGAANEYFQKNIESIKKLQERNVPIRTSYNVEAFLPRGAVKKAFGEQVGNLWNSAISDPTFKRFMPALQIQMFNEVEKSALKAGKNSGEAADIAAKAVKNFYGVTGSDTEALRSKLTNDTMGAVLFAPKFRESMINFWVNSVKGLKNPLAPENINNTKFLVGAITAYAVMSETNKRVNGNYMHENPSGKEDKLLIPLGDGTTLGIPYLSSIATVPRGLYRVANQARQGNFGAAGRDAFQTFGSMSVKPVADVLTNQNYFGQEIYDPEGSTKDKFINSGKYIAGSMLPQAVKSAGSVATGKEPTYQSASKALELPFRFYKTESIKNAPFWDEYHKIKPLSDQIAELKYKDPQKAAQLERDNADKLQKYGQMKLAVKAYYTDNKNSKFIQEFGNGTAQVGKNVVIAGDEVIDVAYSPKMPKLSGSKEIDKKLLSAYKGELTTKENDIVKLYQSGYYTVEQAEKQLKQIDTIRDFLKSASGGGKKLVTNSELMTAYRRALKASLGLSQPPKSQQSVATSYGRELQNRARNFKSVI